MVDAGDLKSPDLKIVPVRVWLGALKNSMWINMSKKYRVAVNECFGGFGLSNEAARRLLDLGYTPEYMSKSYSSVDDIPRHHPLLLQVLEELGEKAVTKFSRVVIKEVESPLYRIISEDGYESLETPDLIAWINAEEV